MNNPNWSHVAKIQRKYDRLPRSIMENSVDRREKMRRIKLTEDVVKMMSSIESNKKPVEALFMYMNKDESDLL